MRQAVLLGNPDTKRTSYFGQAAAGRLPVLLADWKGWREQLPEGNMILKIDPPLWESCALEELEELTEDYIVRLMELSYLGLNGRAEFFNHPKAIANLLDKRACKLRLMEAGVPVTEPLKTDTGLLWRAGTKNRPGPLKHDKVIKNCREEQNVEELITLMEKERVNQVFVKPVKGSGAAGVVAFRRQPATGQMALYTCCLLHPEFGLVNTKRLRRLSEPGEIFPLLEAVLQMDCLVERWYAKPQYQGFSYDLRAVFQEGKMDFLLARLSKGPITNLHLNNHPVSAAQLGLPVSVMESVINVCQKAMECFQGLRSAGIDLLLEKGSQKPRIIEMNAQGDLIYQDIYNQNIIYSHQVEIMKRYVEV